VAIGSAVTALGPAMRWQRLAVVAEGLEVSGPGVGPIVVPFNDLHDAVLMLVRTMLSNDRNYQRWVLSALAARRP
jgi:Fe-S-cluster formation regulator IscX/YfhJ